MKKRLSNIVVVLLGVVPVHLFCEMVFFLSKSDVLSQLDSVRNKRFYCRNPLGDK